MRIFSQQNPVGFGLDISELSLKIAKLEKVDHSFRLVSFGSSDISKGVIVNSKVEHPAVLAKIIKGALSHIKGKKIRDKHVVVSLPEEKSFIDVIKVPNLEKRDEQEQAVRFEAANHIPLDIEDVYFDFGAIASKKSKHQKEVLIAATPKEIVNTYLVSLEGAGLRPVAMEIECLAVVRSLVKGGKSAKPLALVDFGETRTSFMLFSGTSLRFTSTIPISSRALTEKVAEQLKINPEKANRLKHQEGLIGQKRVADALSLVLNDLVGQITTHLKYYHTHTAKNGQAKKRPALDKIILCGGGVNLKGLPDFLTGKLGIPAELGNPWVNILPALPKEVPSLPFEESLGYTTALGLALRNFYNQ